MKKNTKKTIIATLIGGITVTTIATALLCVKPVKASDDASLYMQDTYTQQFIDRIAKYTDSVYITSMYNEETDSFEAMNGNVIVSSNGKDVGLFGSNNMTKLKDTVWFSHDVWVNEKDQIVEANTEGATKVPCRTMPAEWTTSDSNE